MKMAIIMVKIGSETTKAIITPIDRPVDSLSEDLSEDLSFL